MSRENIYNVMALAGAAALAVVPNFWTLGVLITIEMVIGTYEVLRN